MFTRLRGAAVAFDRRLRNGVTDDDLATLRRVLPTMQHNVISTATETEDRA
jgi:hypothetical protein